MFMMKKFILVIALQLSGYHAIATPPDRMMGQSHPINHCAGYKSQVNRAVQNSDLDSLEYLLTRLNTQSDCSISYVDSVKRRMAQIASAKAGRLIQQERLAEAEKWLRRAPTMVWNTQVVHGDIAALQRKWLAAAQFYNQAWDLMNDPQATPQAPSSAKTEEIFQLASGAQILAGDLDATVGSSGEARGIMGNSKGRGRYNRRRPLPVQFKFGGSRLNNKGKKSVEQLAKYFKMRRATQVTLIGHSDRVGSHAACDRVSKKRAAKVRKELQGLGVKARINAIGKGKREPFPIPRRWKLKQSKIDALNRRVEFSYR